MDEHQIKLIKTRIEQEKERALKAKEEADKRAKEELDRKLALENEIKEFFKDLPPKYWFCVKIRERRYETFFWLTNRFDIRYHNKHLNTFDYDYILIYNHDNYITIAFSNNEVAPDTEFNNAIMLGVLNHSLTEEQLLDFRKSLPWIAEQLVKRYGYES